MTSRDFVQLESNERLDLPDLLALQSNARSYAHLGWRLFVSDPTLATPNFVLQGFKITANSPADSQVNVSNGVGLGGITLPDGTTLGHGVFFGQEGPSSQALDFSGEPIGVYNVYVRCSFDVGTGSTRIFFNGTTNAEESDSIDTRFVFGWDATFDTSSPGDEWQKVGEVDWDGSTAVSGDITRTRVFFWEGHEDASYASSWGGGTDRSSDRATYGVQTEKQWIEAVRKQLEDVIGLTGWWASPTADLAEVRSHIDDVTDAHSSSPTWTGTVTAGELAFGLTTHQFQDPIDMSGLCSALDSGFLAKVGTWIVEQGNTSTVNFEGRASWVMPSIYLQTAAPGDYIRFDIQPYLRPGCMIDRVIVIAEADAGTIDLDCAIESQAWAGTSSTVTGHASSTQTISNNGRKVTTYTFAPFTPAGILASASAGQHFYHMRLEVSAVAGGAAELMIYGIYIVSQDGDVREILGKATAT